jgi:hypothetical protein
MVFSWKIVGYRARSMWFLQMPAQTPAENRRKRRRNPSPLSIEWLKKA